jgi:hypothetical protein
MKRPGRGVIHPPPSGAHIKERVEPYFYSCSVPAWPDIGRTLPFTLPKKECVYCAVRTKYLYKIHIDLSLKAMPMLKRLVAGSYRRGPDSIPGQSMWDLSYAKWHRDRASSEYFGFPLSVSFHHCSILISIYTFLSTRTNGRGLGTAHKKYSFRKREVLDRKVLSRRIQGVDILPVNKVWKCKLDYTVLYSSSPCIKINFRNENQLNAQFCILIISRTAHFNLIRIYNNVMYPPWRWQLVETCWRENSE